MKKTVYVDDFCCARCAEQLATKLALLDGVRAAKANYKKKVIFVDVTEAVTTAEIEKVFDGSGTKVLSVELRKGIFG